MTARVLVISVVCLLCACATPPPVKDALAISACPELSPVRDETFGGTVQALVETSLQYNKCRAAALGLTPTASPADEPAK